MVLVFDRQVREMEVPETDGTNISAQDMYNEIQIFLANSKNMDEAIFMTASGKQPLGASNQVGITMKLVNTWLLGFEERPGPALIACLVSGGNFTAEHTDTGSATSGGTTTLTDTAATFARHASQTGDAIRNVTDGSSATIVSVDSETVVTHTALTGGTDNDWDIADVWEIDSTHPFYPTAFTHVGFAQDAAPVDVTGIGGAAAAPDESHIATAYILSTDTINMSVWLERQGVTVVSPTSCTVNWYNADGTLLFSETDAGPDAQGIFEISRAQPLAKDTAYYAEVSVTDATGTIQTTRGLPTTQ